MNVADICNLALSHLGESEAITSVSEDSSLARLCARYYPLARDTLLERHPWDFATQQQLLPPIQAVTGRWSCAYRLPADVLRVIAITPPAGTPRVAFECLSDETGLVLLTHEPQALMRAVMRVQTAEGFPPLFTQALAWQLASDLAGALMKTPNEVTRCLQMGQLALHEAAVSDARQQYQPADQSHTIQR